MDMWKLWFWMDPPSAVVEEEPPSDRDGMDMENSWF